MAESLWVRTWKLLDDSVSLYPNPDIHSSPVMELAAGQIILVRTRSSGKTAQNYRKRGQSWFKVMLPTGIEGYLRKEVSAKNIGAAQECICCGNIDPAGEIRCSVCKVYFRAVRFTPPNVLMPDIYKINEVGVHGWSSESKSNMSVPHACCCCCTTTNLQPGNLSGSFSDDTRSISTSGYMTVPVYFCQKCSQIRGVAVKHKHHISRLGYFSAILLILLVLLGITFLCALIYFFSELHFPVEGNLLSPASYGSDILLSMEIMLSSLGLFVGFYSLLRWVENKKKAFRNEYRANISALIKLGGYTYQPADVWRSGNGWILSLFNRDYANLFRTHNPSFSKMDY
jgi:hypothetical protein